MPACPSCGASNAADAETCAYCDREIVAHKDLEVQWEAETGEGVRGKGSLIVVAPRDTDVARVRSQVQAAFSATLDALGTGAGRGAVEEAMRERLRDMLPADQRLTELRLSDLAVASSGVALRRACASVASLGVLLLCLIFAWAAAATSAGQAWEDLHQARAVTVEEAAASEGELVALEAVVAGVDSASALSVPGGEEPAVALALSEYSPDYATEFSLAGLPAVPGEDPVLLDVPKGKRLPEVDGVRVVRPGDEVTAVARVEDGVLHVRLMSPPVSPEALARKLETKGGVSLGLVIAFVVIGLAVPLVVWKSRTVRTILKI